MILLILDGWNEATNITVVPGLYSTEASCLHAASDDTPYSKKYQNVGYDCIKVEGGINND